MAAAVEAMNVGDDERYSDDSFQDDFESASSDTPRRAMHAVEKTPPSATAAAAAQDGTPMSASSKTATTTTTATSTSASAPSARSSRHSSVLHSMIKSPAYPTSANAHAADAAADAAAPARRSVSSSSSSAASSHSVSRSASAHSAHSAAAAAHDVYHAEHEEESSLLPADHVPAGEQRRADGSGSGSAPHSRGGRVSAEQHGGGDVGEPRTRRADGSQRGYTSGTPSVAESRRIRRPEVPETVAELRAMQEENARMRDELFQRSREQYHTSLAQGSSSKSGGTFNANRTVGGPAASSKTAAASNPGRHREAAARLVQESLMVHRTLQVLRVEQRELVHRRDELRTLVSRYKRASKYKDLVEEAKEDIAVLTDDHRDAHLEVRCNEKLLVLNDAMTETGVGERRLLEEIRSQNALTQRRREHALRDADNAQRVRDAAAQRVEELKLEVAKRHPPAGGSGHTEGYQLRVMNQAKKDRIHELRAQLQQLRHEQEDANAGARPHGVHASHRHRHLHNQRDDAEREYLKTRIAEMRREIERGAGGSTNMAASGKASTSGGNSVSSPVRDTQVAVPSPHSATPRSDTPATATAHPAAAATPHTHAPAPSTDAAPAPAPAAPSTANDEIDVTAWLSAHPAGDAVAGSGVAPSQRPSHDTTVFANLYPRESAPAATATAEALHAEEDTPAPAPPAADEPPAWLEAETGAVAEAEAASPAPAMSYEEVDHVDEVEEEEVVESEEVSEAPAPALPAHEEAELDNAMFGIGGAHGAAAAAPPPAPEAENNDDGPDWLNF
ncbi:hypothetical protein NESM_000026600 [Novymonas esmeraldas]|uniref:Lebercilin domain-containing protein n=1 Tax=Novymonas esmeraldas TaxID=1808958 RepID=A0AAW0F317_9TRYP